MQTVTLMLACTDTRNGVHPGHCDQIEVYAEWLKGDVLISLEGRPWQCRISCKDPGNGYQGSLHFGHLRLPWIPAQSWVGNSCWDAVQVPLSAAARLVHTLQKSPSWSLIEAEALCFQAWQEERPRTPEEWETLFTLAGQSMG